MLPKILPADIAMIDMKMNDFENINHIEKQTKTQHVFSMGKKIDLVLQSSVNRPMH